MYSNIIPIGDHCAISILLKELDLRKKSYPFDWTTHQEQVYNTNIMHNVDIIRKLNHDSIENIVNDYLGEDITTGKHGLLCFPHEVGTKQEITAKYERRFERLKQDLNETNMYIMLTRHYYINQPIFESIMETLLKNDSTLLFISGTNHPYFETMQYKNVIFKYIPYDISQFYDYDYSTFRPAIKDYLFNNVFHDRSS
jgi:hypothetical protein